MPDDYSKNWYEELTAAIYKLAQEKPIAHLYQGDYFVFRLEEDGDIYYIHTTRPWIYKKTRTGKNKLSASQMKMLLADLIMVDIK